MKDDDIGDILQSQADDYTRWQGDAHRQLREGDLQTAPGDRVLQFLELPSLGYPSVLNVYKIEKQQYCVSRTMKNQTIRAPLNREEFERHYLQLCSQSLPSLLPSTHFGLDGTSYELAVGNIWLGWRLNWWEELPEQWGHLKNVVTEMIVFLRKNLVQGEQV